jgi:hypothetical protein
MSQPSATRDAGYYRADQAMTREEYYRRTDGGARPLERQLVQKRSGRGGIGSGLRDAT